MLDEVGRGTSTQDGLAVAKAILNHLCTNTGCKLLFATHYHELIPYAESIPTLKLYKTNVEEDEAGIIFTHAVTEGASDNSFGIEVGRLAGLPNTVIQLAQSYLAESGSGTATPFIAKVNTTRKPSASSQETSPDEPMHKGYKAIFDPDPVAEGPGYKNLQSIAEKLERIQIVKTTPLQALNLLDQLQADLFRPKSRTLFEKSLTKTTKNLG